MIESKRTRSALLALVGAFALGCGGEEPRRRVPNVAASPAPAAEGGTRVASADGAAAAPTGGAAGSASGWGTIKGRVVWGGSGLPEVKELTVTKDEAHCKAAGPIPDETIVVDKETKGVANVFVYLVKPKAIHDSFPKDKKAVKEADAKAFAELNGGLEFTADALNAAVGSGKATIKNLKAPAMLDQLNCRYVPHAVALREGQQILVLNGEPVAHNVKVTSVGGKNDANPNMPPNTLQLFSWVAEANPLNVECAIHGWMRMYAMVFDHPYFTVTGKDGSFELKNVPAGDNMIVLRNPKFISLKEGGKATARGEKVTVKADGETDLGEVKVMP